MFADVTPCVWLNETHTKKFTAYAISTQLLLDECAGIRAETGVSASDAEIADILATTPDVELMVAYFLPLFHGWSTGYMRRKVTLGSDGTEAGDYEIAYSSDALRIRITVTFYLTIPNGPENKYYLHMEIASGAGIEYGPEITNEHFAASPSMRLGVAGPSVREIVEGGTRHWAGQ